MINVRWGTKDTGDDILIIARTSQGGKRDKGAAEEHNTLHKSWRGEVAIISAQEHIHTHTHMHTHMHTHTLATGDKIFFFLGGGREGI